MNRKRWAIAVSVFLLIVLAGATMLLTYRAAQQERLNAALIAAVRERNASQVASLLEQGADPDACEVFADSRPFWKTWLDRLLGRPQNTSGSPALYLALGFRINPPNPKSLRRAGFAISSHDSSPEIVAELLNHGARPEQGIQVGRKHLWSICGWQDREDQIGIYFALPRASGKPVHVSIPLPVSPAEKAQVSAALTGAGVPAMPHGR
jgi:hypothetical protein